MSERASEIASDCRQRPEHLSEGNSLRQEATGFAFVGAVGFAIDAGLTLAFSHSGWLSPVAARLPATALAIVATFILNKVWTFQSRNTSWLSEFLRYVGVSIGGAGINFLVYAAFLMLLSVSGLTASDNGAVILLAVVAGSGAAALFNFIGARYVAFARRASLPPAA